MDLLHCSGWAACVLLVVRNVYVVCSCSRVCACDAREFTLVRETYMTVRLLRSVRVLTP